MDCNKKVFFIGFHKTATTAFHRLFQDSGYVSFHTKCPIKSSKPIPLAKRFYENIENNKPILTGIENSNVYCDLHHMVSKRVYDGNLLYKELHKEYPNSYFIMQTRPTEDWIRSRLNHKTLLERYARGLGMTLSQTEIFWREQKLKVEQEIKEYFAANNKFLVYDITKHKINLLIDFVKDDFSLNKKYWSIHNKTTSIRENYP